MIGSSVRSWGWGWGGGGVGGWWLQMLLWDEQGLHATSVNVHRPAPPQPPPPAPAPAPTPPARASMFSVTTLGDDCLFWNAQIKEIFEKTEVCCTFPEGMGVGVQGGYIGGGGISGEGGTAGVGWSVKGALCE